MCLLRGHEQSDTAQWIGKMRVDGAAAAGQFIDILQPDCEVGLRGDVWLVQQAGREFPACTSELSRKLLEPRTQDAEQFGLACQAVMSGARDDREDLVDDEVVGEPLANFTVIEEKA